MATLRQANETYARARVFYKGMAKSTNKMYSATGEAELDTAQQARNDLTKQSLINMKNASRSASNYAGKTPYNIGATLHGQNNTSGNCGEMAAVAIYLAISKVHVPPGEVSMWTLTNTMESQYFACFNKKFAHSFAVLGKNSGRYVVDPWGGVVCAVDDYAALMGAKLTQWGIQGKRILAAGDWVEPTNALVVGVLSTRSKFREDEAMVGGS